MLTPFNRFFSFWCAAPRNISEHIDPFVVNRAINLTGGGVSFRTKLTPLAVLVFIRGFINHNTKIKDGRKTKTYGTDKTITPFT
jgi:hypothetical protein